MGSKSRFRATVKVRLRALTTVLRRSHQRYYLHSVPVHIRCNLRRRDCVEMWEARLLNDGRPIPGIAFGTAYTSKSDLPPRIVQAIAAGFRHFDTAEGKGMAR